VHRTSRSESTPNISEISSPVKEIMVLTGLKACRSHDAAAIFSSLTRIKTPVQGGGSCLLDRPRVNTGSPSESPQAQRPYVLAQPSLKLFLSNRISSQIANLIHRRYCANAQRLRVAAIEALGRLKRGRWGAPEWRIVRRAVYALFLADLRAHSIDDSNSDCFTS